MDEHLVKLRAWELASNPEADHSQSQPLSGLEEDTCQIIISIFQEVRKDKGEITFQAACEAAKNRIKPLLVHQPDSRSIHFDYA